MALGVFGCTACTESPGESAEKAPFSECAGAKEPNFGRVKRVSIVDFKTLFGLFSLN
jgi:hypothetical protein